MAKFTQDNQPQKRRGKGKKKLILDHIDQDTLDNVMRKLIEAALAGESWAIVALVDRVYPKLKQVNEIENKLKESQLKTEKAKLSLLQKGKKEELPEEDAAILERFALDFIDSNGYVKIN